VSSWSPGGGAQGSRQADAGRDLAGEARRIGWARVDGIPCGEMEKRVK
jgi:hypothetical protein